MTLTEIKKAIADGQKVYCNNKSYEVKQDKNGNYNIIRGSYCIGLTWLNGITLNGKEEDFFTE